MKMKTIDSTLIFLLKKVEAAYYNCAFWKIEKETSN